MSKSLKELIAQLKSNARVVSIVRYGGRSPDDNSAGGDFDVFVFVEERPLDLESIHFFWGDIPVDLSLRTIEDLHRNEPLSYIDLVLKDAEILYDRIGQLSQQITTACERWERKPGDLAEHEINFNRFCQQHVLDKVRDRLKTQPLFCEFLLGTNIYWLVQTYFKVRGLAYLGERLALEQLAKEAPQIERNIAKFYAAKNLMEKFKITEALTEQVLSPLGGPWHKGEVIAFGVDDTAENLNEKGRQMFTHLFGGPLNR